VIYASIGHIQLATLLNVDLTNMQPLPRAQSFIDLLAHRIHSAIMHYRHGADVGEDVLREGVAAELVRSC
jgi:hypothetical protein